MAVPEDEEEEEEEMEESVESGTAAAGRAETDVSVDQSATHGPKHHKDIDLGKAETHRQLPEEQTPT